MEDRLLKYARELLETPHTVLIAAANVWANYLLAASGKSSLLTILGIAWYLGYRSAEDDLEPELKQLRDAMQEILTIAADNVDKGNDEWLELIWHISGANCPDGKYCSQEAHRASLQNTREYYLEMKSEADEHHAKLLQFLGDLTEDVDEEDLI